MITQRLIGIDHGLARIGVAVSDRVGLTARELAIITRKSKREDFERLNAIAAEQDAAAFIVGLPTDDEAPEGVYTQDKRVKTWVEQFKTATTLPILLWDEQLTTVDAHELARSLKRPVRAHVDDLAARLILQSYLDAVREGLAEPPSAGQT
ncbi:MAG: Holliday junction resolvase RuvX [Chloroflexi bacterium]|nr:Holliday junction resolvase RuvX [Chloroflexota bacterium]